MFTEARRRIPITNEVDVLVVGGGLAGSSAAIAAGRMGLKTLIIEYFGYLGGNATNSLVSSLCGFFTYTGSNMPVVKGIGGEIVQTLIDRKGGKKRKHLIEFDPEIVKIVLDEKVIEAKVEPLYYTQMVAPIIKKNIIKGVIIENKAGRQAIMAKRVLDCTGDGDVCALANVPFELGDGKGSFQACDMVFRLLNVKKRNKSSPKELVSLLEEGVKSSEYKLTRSGGFLGSTLKPGVYWANMARIPWIVNGIDPGQLTMGTIEGRKIVREFARFLIEKVPGMEHADIVQTASKLGLRETRRVMGEYLLTGEDILNGTKFEDAIGVNAWPIEIHVPGEMVSHTMSLKGDDFHTIPYRCLLPKRVEDLLMAGRFVSCTHEAQASIRVMGPASVMGQAIATAAVLSIKEGISPRKLNVKLLQKELKNAGVFLG